MSCRHLFALLPLLITASLTQACDPPAPVGLVAFLDSSASFEKHQEAALGLLKAVNSRLESGQDRVLAFHVSSDVFWVFDSEKPGGKKLGEALQPYIKVDPVDRGTAYGSALAKGIAEVRALERKVARSALLIVGDGQDEPASPGRNVNWETVGRDFQTFPKQSEIFFLFIEPRYGDRFRDALRPVLGDRAHFFNPESTLDGTAKKRILEFLER